MKNQYDIEIRQGYGLTEASPIVTWNNTNIKNLFGSVGPPMPWNDIKIVKNKKIAGQNTEGEICVKGLNVMKGYYKQKETPKIKITNGWLQTGDFGYIDDNGYLYITGRKKNMLIKNGLNIYPKEVKRLIENHPLVKEIHVSTKINKQEDGTINESLEALIYAKHGHKITHESFLEWCMENISKYKIPDVIWIK